MSEQINLKDVPFAPFLEQAIPELCRMKVRCIGMVALFEDDGVATNFWNASANDLAAMGVRLIEDGVMDTIRNNGAMLKQAIEDAEREQEEDEGKEDA